jgi:hypothetical protein
MIGTTKLFLALAAGAFLFSCTPAEEEATDEMAADTTAVVEAPGITLADVAGTWDVRSVPVSGPDTTATEYQLVATADGFTLHLPDRDPIIAVTTVSGDSIITDAGPFQSVRRDNVMVTTHAVWRLEGDRLVGETVAHYETSDPDSVLVLRTEATRAP